MNWTRPRRVEGKVTVNPSQNTSYDAVESAIDLAKRSGNWESLARQGRITPWNAGGDQPVNGEDRPSLPEQP